ncbi:MAG: GntR family transcriptional regulator [Caulobacteraceae bacterium]
MTAQKAPRQRDGVQSAETVVEYAINAIREQIRDGRLGQGQRLVVADVTRKLGVSNGPVREAIRRLTGEGLVEIVPHKGAAVREFSNRDVREIFEVREVVEGLAARLAAERIGPGDSADRLRAVQAESRAVLDGGKAYIEHNHSFHELIYALAANARVQEQARQLTLPIYRLRMHQLMNPAYARTSAAEHRLIVDAILSGDGAAAEWAMRNHIRNSGAAMLEALARQPADPKPGKGRRASST